MKVFIVAALILLTAVISSGCAPTRVWTSSPASAATRNDRFAARFTPSQTATKAFNRFQLEIINTGTQPLEIDWTHTRHLYQDRPTGGFVFAGLDKSTVNNPPPDIVAPGGELRKWIAPLKFIAWRGYKPGYRDAPAFTPGPLPAGKNGIRLVVRQGGRVFEERLSVTIKIEKR
jgi:hypothetical protein